MRQLTLLAALVMALPAGAQRLVRVSGPSPFASCGADAVSTQSGVNYPGSEVEPRLAVDPRNPRHLVGVWQQDRFSDGSARGLLAGVSFDGGASWRSSVITGLTPCSGGVFTRASDPWVTIAPNGDVYHIALTNGGARSGILVNKSTDGGLTWGTPIALIDESTGVLHDKQSIMADPTDPPGRLVYAVWDKYDDRGSRVTSPALFTRTTDGGRTWEPVRTIYDPGLGNQTIGHQIVVLPDGTLLDFFTEFRSSTNAQGQVSWQSFLALLRSSDRGVTWMGPDGGPFRPHLTLAAGVFSFGTGQPVRTEENIVDVSVALDPRNGRLYAVWQDARFSPHEQDAVAFSQSPDSGFNWTPPIRINRTPTDIASSSQQAFTPTVRVAADGTIGVTYYDTRRDDPAAPGMGTDYWLVTCRPGSGVSCHDPADWKHEVRLTDVAFNMEEAPFARGFFVGDYEGLGTDANDFLALFAQPHPGDSASIFFRRARP